MAFLNFGIVFAGSLITGDLHGQGASSPPKANPRVAWAGGAEAEFGGAFCSVELSVPIFDGSI